MWLMLIWTSYIYILFREILRDEERTNILREFFVLVEYEFCHRFSYKYSDLQ